MLVWCKGKTAPLRDKKRALYTYVGHAPLNVVVLDKQPQAFASKAHAFQVVRMDGQHTVIAVKTESYSQWFEWTSALEESIEKFRENDAIEHKKAIEAAVTPKEKSAHHASEREQLLRAARIARRLVESERDYADDIDTLLHAYW